MALGDKYPVLMSSQLGTPNGPAALNADSLLPILQGGTLAGNPQVALANLGAGVRPNLLRNWNFSGGGSQQGGGQLPINQRGQTSFPGNTTTIDLWFFQSNATPLSLTSEGILFPSSATSTQVLRQNIVNLSEILGETVTISALFSDNSLIPIVIQVPTSGSFDAGTTSHNGIRVNIYGSNTGATFRILGKATENTTVTAVKLELGEGQTLAYQDDNGTWKLLPQPDMDYWTQMLRCQQYYQLYSSADLRPSKAIDCRPVMRIDPTQGTISIDGVTYYYNSAEL